MIAFASEPTLQVQVGEAIALIAAEDFPASWGELIPVSFYIVFHHVKPLIKCLAIDGKTYPPIIS